MAGVDLVRIRELRQPLQRVKEAFGAFARLDGQVGSRRVADEERVAGENEPVVDDEGAVLRPVAGRVDHADRHGTGRQLLAVLERLEGNSGSASGWTEIGTPCSSANRPCPET